MDRALGVDGGPEAVADDELTPTQRRVVDDLMARGAPRPSFDPDLPVRLVDGLESALADVAGPLGRRELRVNKHALAAVLACEAHHAAHSRDEFGWSPKAARGTVAHKAIELSLGWPGASPLDLVQGAVERFGDDDGDRSPGRWLRSATPAERAQLVAEVNELVTAFQECWPPLKRAWSPRSETAARVELLDGRIVMSARADLGFGTARGTQARVLVVDLKSGEPRARHVDDLRFYALLHTIRTGVPPFRVASYYLDAGTFHHEDVTEELLLGPALDRLVDGVSRMVALHLRTREPARAAGPQCGWCPIRDGCPAAGSVNGDEG